MPPRVRDRIYLLDGDRFYFDRTRGKLLAPALIPIHYTHSGTIANVNADLYLGEYEAGRFPCPFAATIVGYTYRMTLAGPAAAERTLRVLGGASTLSVAVSTGGTGGVAGGQSNAVNINVDAGADLRADIQYVSGVNVSGVTLSIALRRRAT